MNSSDHRKSPIIIETDAMREFAGHFATGVGVITASNRSGERFGLTMNAITSLSLNPPLYLVCLDEQSRTLPAILETRAFGINFLREDQQALCARFAARGDDKFSDTGWSPGPLNVPLLDGVLATAVCSLHAVHPGGDHRIVVGRPERCEVYGGKPLLYYRGGFLVATNDQDKPAILGITDAA